MIWLRRKLNQVITTSSQMGLMPVMTHKIQF